MRGGDIIPLNTDGNISAQVGGVPVLECKYGISNGQYALKVEKILASSFAGELMDGGKHG
jgi:flagellar motor switch protein FliM